LKRKLERFKIISELPNVVEPGKEIYSQIKGNWGKDYFKNNNPITVELACGRGEYTIGLAKRFPERNFIGVDIKGDRIWKGSTIAHNEGLSNVAFLRTVILVIENFFEENEVDEIWLTFPDPRPRKRDIKRRLSGYRYINIYKRLLKAHGFFRFKTDNTALFDFTLEELNQRPDIKDFKFTHDLYSSELREECFDIKTKYEEMFESQGETIKYLRFRFVY
jgi:tRNA (guanine-N7-)-methyltransferase